MTPISDAPPGGAERIPLSVPHLGERERGYVGDAFDSNWIAPLGPHVDAFENEFAQLVGAPSAAATSSGTAALHLALVLAGVGAGDEVIVSTLTFVASVNPILYQGATPVFVDSEPRSWNMDPALLAEAVEDRVRRGRPPAAVVLVHLYGQCADLEPIVETCRNHRIALIEDAAEALGSDYRGRAPGTFGDYGIFSFNGNKIITTAGGGMLVARDPAEATRARKLASQAREEAPHYQHIEVGYNYRLSNLLAAVGRGQLEVLEERVRARRAVFERYRELLGDIPGLTFMPEADWGRHTRWLTVLTLDPSEAGATREDVRTALAAGRIEARPAWKPMHLQPLFADAERVGGCFAESVFERGLCLPSSSSLSNGDIERVADAVRGACGR